MQSYRQVVQPVFVRDVYFFWRTTSGFSSTFTYSLLPCMAGDTFAANGTIIWLMMRVKRRFAIAEL